jgi:cob(I)alamin adenosyltransferase
MKSLQYRLVILDEVNVAVHAGLLEVESVHNFLDEKPETVHLILTGRNVHDSLIDRADMVSEIKNVKHPYQKGDIAQKGIDY